MTDEHESGHEAEGATSSGGAATALLSIVIPLFNEEAMIPILAERLEALAASLRPVEVEFVLVDDGSRDRTLELSEDLADRDERFQAISLSRNYGHQVAITAGLDFARGDAVVFMDADMQDPPEVVAEMVAKWREGFDVVYGRRVKREQDTFFKRVTAAAFYKTLRYLSQIDIPENVGDFRLLSREAADALKQLRERHRLMRGLCAWVGFRQTSVDYERPERAAGETKYTVRKMVGLALDSLFSFSWFPLRMASLAGILVTSVCALGAIVSVFLRLFSDLTLPGWTSMVTLICFVGGMNLLMVGILGEYVGRVFEEVKRRPLYYVRKTRRRSAPHAGEPQ